MSVRCRVMITLLSVLLRVFPASSFMTSRSGGGCTATNKFLRVKQHPQLHLIDHSCDIASSTRTQRHRLSWKCYSTNEPNNNHCDDVKNEDVEQKQLQVEITADSLTPSQIQSLSPDSQSSSFWGALKSFFSNKKNKFSRESLGKMGMSALLAYGFVSNVSGVIAVSCAWFIFSRRTGLSPLAPGQKAAFLAIYAGFTVMLNVIRPARFALSISISPYFEKIRKFLQRKFNVSPRGAAVLMIVFINLLGTCSLMCLGVTLASVLSGVPVWSGRLL